jgi:hypothetical protein
VPLHKLEHYYHYQQRMNTTHISNQTVIQGRTGLLHRGARICSVILFSFEASAQMLPQNISADELVRRTAEHELAAAKAGGHYQYCVEEHTTRGSETRDVLESRSWSIDRLILRNGRPLTVAEQQGEEQRLRHLLSNPGQLGSFQKEQLSRRERLRTMIAAFPQAFSCQYDGAAQENSRQGLIRLKFRPNPGFADRSWELRPLQGMEGTLLIDPEGARLVRVEARFFRDVDFGGGILGQIDRGGSFEFEQQSIGDGRRALTTLALHYNKRVLLAKIRVDSVTTTSGFLCSSEDMTLQQGLEHFLKPSQTTVAYRGAETSP